MKTKVAIMYDFDKTLSVLDMQEYSFIPSLGYKSADIFWQEVKELAENNKMDRILAYMWLMLRKAQANHKPIRHEDFVALGKDIELFKGVDTWFERINTYGDRLGLDIEHYIISSGLAEVIEGSKIAKNFKKIYACRYFYDENQVASWPALVVNYTTKTQYLFRINKGVLEETEDKALNDRTRQEDRRIPFRRMIYVGDGYTDVPSFNLVNDYGGKAIVVYNEQKNESYQTALALYKEKRANYMVKADYAEGQPMEKLVQNILLKIKAEYNLELIEGRSNGK